MADEYDRSFPGLTKYRAADPVEREGSMVIPLEPQVAPAAAPSTTDVPAAVRWVGSWEQAHDGTAIITRRMARALDAAGLPVFLPGAGFWTREQIEPAVMAEVDALVARTPRALPAQIHHIVPHEPRLRAALYPGRSLEKDQEGAESRHATMALFSVWEQIPDREWRFSAMAIYLRKFARHIVPCEMNRKVLQLAGVRDDRIHVIPHPYDTHEAEALMDRPARAPGPVRFYSIGKWEPRKDPMTLIRAFLCAMSLVAEPEKKGHLTLYTSDWWRGGDYPRPAEALAKACELLGMTSRLREAQRWVTIDTRPHASLVPEHHRNDVYVTASHGEAWGMPAHDAVVAGNLVLAPGWGGFEAFVPEAGHLPYRLVQAHPRYAHPWDTTGLWAHVDEQVLAERLHAILEEPSLAARVPFSEESAAAQSPEAVGQALREVVERMVGPYNWAKGER